MIDAVQLDYRPIGIDQDRQVEAMSLMVRSHLRAALANDHHDFGS
jgi:hypothetical protein